MVETVEYSCIINDESLAYYSEARGRMECDAGLTDTGAAAAMVKRPQAFVGYDGDLDGALRPIKTSENRARQR